VSSEPALPAIDPPAEPGDTETGDAGISAPSLPQQRLFQGGWGLLDVLIVGPLIASSIYYYVGLPLGQWLILHNQAITAELVRGSLLSMILAGSEARTGGVSPWMALLAPLPITMITDPCCFYAGRRYGRVFIDYIGRNDPRWIRRVAQGERIYARFAGWAVFLAPVIWLPNAVFYFLAGETGMRFPKFILLDTAGEFLYIVEIVALGYFIGKPAQQLASTLSGYSLWIVLGTLALVVTLGSVNGMRQQRRRGGRS
jgi:membrane protein DedA with SNARE-associated domain